MKPLTAPQQRVADFLKTIPVLSKDLGTPSCPCSIGAVNIALTGRLTDHTPPGVDSLLSCLTVQMQDSCPATICRESEDWRRLLPLLVGTGSPGRMRKRVVSTFLAWYEAFIDTALMGEVYTLWRMNKVDYKTTLEQAFADARGDKYDLNYSVTRLVRVIFNALSILDNDPTHPIWTALNPCGLLEKLITVATWQPQPGPQEAFFDNDFTQAKETK